MDGLSNRKNVAVVGDPQNMAGCCDVSFTPDVMPYDKRSQRSFHSPPKAFTLIELLVVIAIIALLLSILLPTLKIAKDKAKTAVCLSRMRQWNFVTLQYGGDNDAKFPDPSGGIHGHWWIDPLRPYYDDPKIRLCPAAYLPPEDFGWTSDRKPNQCWASNNPFPELESGDYIYGSLSPNGWLMDISQRAAYGGMKDLSWENLNQVTPNVPLFLDCFWVDGWPKDDDIPQPNPESVATWNIDTYPMQRFNINRHRGAVTTVYMDGSCRTVGLKGLWRLKWHRQFNTNNDWTRPTANWPDWMRNYNDKH